MPKVSIIVPTYNVEQYLVECLESIVNQTLRDIEIICVDDGSKDNSGKILDEYAVRDSRFKVIHKKNEGYGKAMNVGLDNATGDYIGIVEPDDYIDYKMYETLYNKAVETNVDFVKSDFYRFTGKGESLDRTYNQLDKTNCYYNKIINLQEDTTPFNFIMNTWCGIYKRSFIEEYKIRHNETPGASFQDNGFWFQTFAFAKNAYFMDIPFYMNRRDNENSSVKSKGKVFCIMDEFKFIDEKLKKNLEQSDKITNIYQSKKFTSYLYHYNRIDNKFKWCYLKRFSKEFKQANRLGFLNNLDLSEVEKQQLKLIITNPLKYYLAPILYLVKLYYIMHTKKKLVCWGASLFLEDFIKRYNIRTKNIIGIIDKNSQRQGKKIKDYKIFSPDELKDLDAKYALLTIKNNNADIYKDLKLLFENEYKEIELLPNIFEGVFNG